MSKRERWELLKLNIIGESQRYSYERAANRKLIISQLEEKIAEYEEKRDQNSLSEIDFKLYQRTKNDMNEFLDERAQGAIFRSGQAFYSLGEKSNKYFFNLEKSKSAAKGMTALIKGNNIVTDPQKILEEQFLFYKQLYTSNPEVEFKYVNTSETKLNEQERNSLEGEIQMHELCTAISQLKRGRAPGADGIISEFYMMNVNLIKQPLLDAINEGYREGQVT